MTARLALVFFVRVGLATRRMCKLRQDVVADKTATLYRYYEVFQHSISKDGFIRAIVALLVVCLCTLPLANLATDNVPLAVVFAFLGLFSALHHYINPSVLLLEDDRKGYFCNLWHAWTREKRRAWRQKSQLYHTVAVGDDVAWRFWTYAYVIWLIFFVALVLMAANNDADPAATLQSSMTLNRSVAYCGIRWRGSLSWHCWWRSFCRRCWWGLLCWRR